VVIDLCFQLRSGCHDPYEVGIRGLFILNAKNMRSIKRRFDKVAESNPEWSSCVCFANAVRGQKFGRSALMKMFNKLVDQNDYSKADKRGIISFLFKLALEEHYKSAVNEAIKASKSKTR